MTKLHGKVSKIAMLVALVAVPGAVLAEDYRFEARGSFEHREDSGSLFDGANTFNLGGSWYFAPVEANGVPRAEAAFLGRASSVSVVLGSIDVLGEHLSAEAAQVSYYFPGNLFYASAGIQRVEEIYAVSSTLVLTRHVSTWFGSVGVTPLDGLLLATTFTEDGYDPNLTARYVGKLPNSHYYTGSISLTKPDGGDTSFGLGFDYFFDRSTSLGLGYTDGAERWELRAEKFFSKSWALAASVNTDIVGNGYALRVTWRH